MLPCATKTQLIFCFFCFLKPKDTIADQSISTFLKCQLCIYATHKSTNKQPIQNYGGSADLLLQPCILCCLWAGTQAPQIERYIEPI